MAQTQIAQTQGTRMKRSVITADEAPAAIGPYSQAIRVGDLVFTSGQIALCAKSGEIVGDGIEGQTRQVLKNLETVLAASGCLLADVVKTNIYLTNLGDFQRVNAIYGEFFKDDPPARATVEVSRLPRDVLVEIDAVACIRQ